MPANRSDVFPAYQLNGVSPLYHKVQERLDGDQIDAELDQDDVTQ